MIFQPLNLDGAYLIKPEIIEDERGFFARTFCKTEFQQHKLISEFVQCNISSNKLKGTLRGMHYQVTPHQETKLVHCIRGSIYDVIIDIRKESSTFTQWQAVELNQSNRNILYIPEGFAHGFITLEDDTEIFYQMSKPYNPDAARTMHWNNNLANINWPNEPLVISEKDSKATDEPLIT
jgi:dTDP-4-dehydrorhamnose 3,5-epimerase